MEASKVSETEKEDRDADDKDDREAASKRSNGRTNGRGKSPVVQAQARDDVAPGMGVGLKNVVTLARRELRSYFDSLIGYVVICLSLIGLGLYFFLWQGGFWQVDRATMGRLFEMMPWALSGIVIPA